MQLFVVLFFLLCPLLSGASAQSQATLLAKEIYAHHPFTFFCEKPIEHDGTVIARACDVCPEHDVKVKWMSIVPTKRLAEHRLCNEKPICVNSKGKAYKGISCCRKVDPQFTAMETDPFNLAPEEPILYQLNRANRIGRVAPTHSQYICDLRHDFRTKTIQPPYQARGIIARTYLYLNTTYDLDLSDEEAALFRQWHLEYPADSWEKERMALIYEKTGKMNSWVH